MYLTTYTTLEMLKHFVTNIDFDPSLYHLNIVSHII